MIKININNILKNTKKISKIDALKEIIPIIHSLDMRTKNGKNILNILLNSSLYKDNIEKIFNKIVYNNFVKSDTLHRFVGIYLNTDILIYNNGGVIEYYSKESFKNILMDHIGICPYCGKTQFFKRYDGKNNYFNFDLDHFFSKDKFPEYAFSILNLIPVCKGCNSISFKGNRDFPDGKYFHPYLGWIKLNNNIGSLENINNDIDDLFDFSEILKNINKIITKPCSISISQTEEHINFFYLNEIYRNSSDSTYDYKFFLHKKDIINYRLTNINKATYSISSKFKYNMEKIRLIHEYFKFWYPENKLEILKIPNGKMKKDLIERFKNI